jgi:uncharacterized protein (DUF2225 family)
MIFSIENANELRKIVETIKSSVNLSSLRSTCKKSVLFFYLALTNYEIRETSYHYSSNDHKEFI